MPQQTTPLTKASLPTENATAIGKPTLTYNCSRHPMLSCRGGVSLFTENVIEPFPPHAHTNHSGQ